MNTLSTLQGQEKRFHLISKIEMAVCKETDKRFFFWKRDKFPVLLTPIQDKLYATPDRGAESSKGKAS